MSWRIGVDIGGTFTDYVLLDDRSGELLIHKRPTTPADPAEGALLGLQELVERSGHDLGDCSILVHGTTLVSNSLIERRGALTALLTTSGFRDILEMGHEQRYDIYDLFLRYPEPLVERRWRLEVDEGMDRDGHPLRPPDLETARAQVREIAAAGTQAVAICLLHSYFNPAHEQMVAEVIRQEAPDLHVSASHEVVPEIREFERTSTTVANAYVKPLIDRYLRRLERELKARGFRGRFYLMQSSGGLASVDVARRFPVRLLESGPAGGARVGAYLGKLLGVREVIAFDMGGTTAKVCLIQDGRPALAAETEVGRVHRFKKGSGLPIKTPLLDLMEIGAGGGSIAFANSLSLLQVGPRSGGADPGPACYGLGGTDATVTGACLALGYLDPASFLGGEMELDRSAADEALARLGARVELNGKAAWGVYEVVCENMASAARVHVVEKGCDPRRFPLIAYGGAGPLHAVRVARLLGAPEVIVPPVSGVAAALGFLVAPVSFEFSRSFPAELRSVDWEAAEALYRDMEEQARAHLRSAGVQEVRIEREVEMRLSGQFHDIVVPVRAGPDQLRKDFDREYARLYHDVLAGYEPLVLNWRLRALGPNPEVRLPGLAGVAGGTARRHRPAYFPEEGGVVVATPVYDRYALGAGT